MLKVQPKLLKGWSSWDRIKLIFIGTLTLFLPWMLVEIGALLLVVGVLFLARWIQKQRQYQFSLQRAQCLNIALENQDIHAIKALGPIHRGTIYPAHIQKNLLVRACELALETQAEDTFYQLIDYHPVIAHKVLKHSRLLFRQEYRAQFNYILKRCFQKFMKSIPAMKFIEDNEIDKDHDESLKTYIDIVFNNDGYLKLNLNHLKKRNSTKNLFKGKALVLKDKKQWPIGYNIFMPRALVLTAVVVEVYGGLEMSQKKHGSYQPLVSKLSMHDVYLLNRGVTIIKLNLPDLLELDKTQLMMSQSLDNIILRCIHHFYHQLKHQPQNLHPRLERLNGLTSVLTGYSFGGRTIARYAQCYPETFDRFISQSGVLSLKADSESSVLFKYNSLLDPATKDRAKKIVKPFLALHAMDDNNVNLKSLLHFYSKLSKKQKKKLFRAYIYPVGSAILSKDLDSKGHNLPIRENAFEQYMQIVFTFIQQGAQAVPLLAKEHYLFENVLANRFNYSATVDEKFCAYSFELSLMHYHQGQNIDERWDQNYQLLYRVLTYIDYLQKNSTILERQIKRLSQKTVVSDACLVRTLSEQTTIFIQFAREYYKFEFPQDFKWLDFWQQPEILSAFREKFKSLVKDSKKSQSYFLFAFYLQNPHFMVLSPQGMPSLHNEDLAKQYLKATLNVYHQVQNHHWRKVPFGLISLECTREMSTISSSSINGRNPILK